MSNIHQPGGHHGVDDEFNRGQPNLCPVCWGKAKKKFFNPERRPRRGVTLNTVYSGIHEQEHEN